MFRKGGSAAEGTGITSGLRKKYQVGGFSLEGYPYDMEVEEDENLGMFNKLAIPCCKASNKA